MFRTHILAILISNKNLDKPIYILLIITHIVLEVYQQCPLAQFKKLITTLINPASIIVPELKNKNKTRESFGKDSSQKVVKIYIFIRDGDPSSFRTLRAL